MLFKNIISLLVLILLSLFLSAQSPTKTIRVLDATTALGENLPEGSNVYNVTTNQLFKAINSVVNTATLTTASASFVLIPSLSDIQDLTDGNGIVDFTYNGTGAATVEADTTILASKTWVGTRGYLTSYSETDPIYANDSANIIWWSDTISTIATQWWVESQNYLTAVTAHASTHITGQSDEIDGDKLDIDWTPTYYQPSTTPAEADNVDNLTAHLYGIDQRLQYTRYYNRGISLNAAAVSTLGTFTTLISAPGAGYYIRILSWDVKITVTTQLEVGAQGLQLCHTGKPTNYFGYISNVDVETATTAHFYPGAKGSSTLMEENTAIGVVLSAAANPVSGSATMVFNINYEILAW